MKKKILIINKAQFGYHTDYNKYCEYLNGDYEITYVCFYTGFEKLKMKNVSVKYIPWKGPKILRGFLFLLTSIFNILKEEGVIFIDYFEKCQVLKKMFPKRKMILNVRTLSVNSDDKIRSIENQNLEKAFAVFDHITLILLVILKNLNLFFVK